jgi:hypothetical protein
LGLSRVAPPPKKFNGAQQFAYAVIVLMGAGSLLSGLAISAPNTTFAPGSAESLPVNGTVGIEDDPDPEWRLRFAGLSLSLGDVQALPKTVMTTELKCRSALGQISGRRACPCGWIIDLRRGR